ncbi:hypothetical protein GH714_013997 [Hevea brasiliensis]|uniref:BTB domain-containing protein n=1 Tax=Hevea brasiliensis TaxID=3981 RepID=A0A6A6N1K2_HEVBR|nr:hypothetical protein GH714_013997 [Hevea brasiliensis]
MIQLQCLVDLARRQQIHRIYFRINGSAAVSGTSTSWNPSSKGLCLGIMEFQRLQTSALSSEKLRTVFNASQKSQKDRTVKKQESYPQNVDLPPVLPKQKKKPYPIPFSLIKKAARKDKKLAEMVHAQRFMWPIQVTIFRIALVRAVLSATVPTHGSRVPSMMIPAVVELCIQAGVDIPEYPSRRRTNPIRMLGKKVIDRGGYVEEPTPWRSANPSTLIDFDTYRACERFSPSLLEYVPKIAQETIDAYEIVRWLCGEYKHQWRDGKHGWQDATVEEVIPPNYVWHVREPQGPPLKSALKSFGKAPAVVEMCMQAARSEIFKNMLDSDACKAPANDTITIPELNHEELESLLEFLYSGSLAAEKVEKHIYSLTLAADKYEIPFLLKFCERYMLRSLVSSNALDVLEISDVCSNKILKETALNFIVKNLEDLVFSAKYETFVSKNPHLSVQITRAFLMDAKSRRRNEVIA